LARTCFADAFYWIALTHSRDAWHSRVVAWQLAHPGMHIVTMEEVLSEFVTWLSAAGALLRSTAAAATRSVLADRRVQVLPQSSASFQEALALFEARPDKGYNLFDCRSMVAMRQFGLVDVLSNDHHFTQEGFNVRFP
jgi:predicted nucleic acid-binding protein